MTDGYRRRLTVFGLQAAVIVFLCSQDTNVHLNGLAEEEMRFQLLSGELADGAGSPPDVRALAAALS